MGDHAWCHDPARDAAVRAAEDGRTSPLPTLAEAIARPFADAAERSVPVSKTGEPQSGMRTERVVLEITHDEAGERVRRMIADMISRCECVVEEAVACVDARAYADRMGCDEERDFANRIVAERDAAIRELSAEKMWRDNLAMQRNEIRDERDALKARVAELEAASGGGEQPRGWLTEDEREIIAGIADDDEYTEEGQNIAKALLARSSPPEVVLPKLHTRCEVNEANNKSPCLWFRRPDVIKSLAAAGVAVKEVGRE